MRFCIGAVRLWFFLMVFLVSGSCQLFKYMKSDPTMAPLACWGLASRSKKSFPGAELNFQQYNWPSKSKWRLPPWRLSLMLNAWALSLHFRFNRVKPDSKTPIPSSLRTAGLWKCQAFNRCEMPACSQCCNSRPQTGMPGQKHYDAEGCWAEWTALAIKSMEKVDANQPHAQIVAG